MEHTSKPASASHRWLECSYCITKGNTIPDEPMSPESILGTAAHSLGEFCLRNQSPPIDFLGKKIKVTDDSNGDLHKVEVTEKMVEDVTMYVDYCNKLSWAGKFGIETKNYVTDTNEEVGGTNDFYCAFNRTLEIVDYKNGVVEVEAEGNTQGLTYGLALLDCNETLQKEIEVVKITVVQPNSFSSEKIKTWTTDRKGLERYRKRVTAALKRIEQFPKQTKSGSWCKWCDVEGQCPQLYKDAEFLAAQDFSDSIDDYYIATIIESESRILSYIKKVKEHAWKKMIERKEKIKDLKIVMGRGKRTFIAKDKVIDILKKSDYRPVDYCKPQEILPLTKLERIVKKEIMEKITVYKEGMVKIVPVADKRPEYIAAEEDFKD